jgi:hypothetical protein
MQNERTNAYFPDIGRDGFCSGETAVDLAPGGRVIAKYGLPTSKNCFHKKQNETKLFLSCSSLAAQI